jgi:hypothetical protein
LEETPLADAPKRGIFTIIDPDLDEEPSEPGSDTSQSLRSFLIRHPISAPIIARLFGQEFLAELTEPVTESFPWMRPKLTEESVRRFAARLR